jgi:trimeric autotransporter adhesin
VVGYGEVVTEKADEGIDTVLSSGYTLADNVENLTIIGVGGSGIGNSQANVLTGNSGDNYLNGGLGVDTMAGGLGNDTYVVDTVEDVVIEQAGAGIDTIKSSFSYTLGANLENLTLTSYYIEGIGNELDNVLDEYGYSTLRGGLGDDTYHVDPYSTVVVEQAEEGIDTVIAYQGNYTLGANMENLILTGYNQQYGIGNELDNTLQDDTHKSTLRGGLGNDTYIVVNDYTYVDEREGEGIDTIQANYSYTMLEFWVENLTLTGTYAYSGTGNALANVLTGNSVDNMLDGGVGIDTMAGGAGNDIYVVDNFSDVVIENTDEGTDTVQSSLSYTLIANVENLTLTGMTDINGTGNDMANVLTGNSVSNILDGGVGADTMEGGIGDDTYIVDNTSDVVFENVGQGTDTVQSSNSYTIASAVENLTLTGADNVNGQGNGLSNIITGNRGDNILDGWAGDDILRGGLGNDTYVFSTGYGNDTIQNYEGTDGHGFDTLQFYNLTMAMAEFTTSGNDLVCTITGTGETIRITDWALGTNYEVETFQFSDGSLDAAQVKQIIG